ncbi:MAG: hypothetical protein ACHP9T_08435 [Caulobacterales bacterium]
MCDPVTLAIVGVVSTAATIATEVQTAQAQNKAIGQQLNQQQTQVQEQKVAALNDRAREARKEQGRMQVAAGEAGLQLDSGSVESMLLDSAMQQKLSDASTGLNAEHQSQANVSEANHLYSDVQKPSIIGAGLRLVSSGVSGYAQGASNVYANQMISRKAVSSAGGS